MKHIKKYEISYSYYVKNNPKFDYYQKANSRFKNRKFELNDIVIHKDFPETLFRVDDIETTFNDKFLWYKLMWFVGAKKVNGWQAKAEDLRKAEDWEIKAFGLDQSKLIAQY